MPIDDRDLATIMVMLGDVRQDVHEILELLGNDDGEEEEAEDHS